MHDEKIIKACNFYVSEWHLFAALLPYLKEELKKNHKIIFISQDKLENGLKELTKKINIKFENKNGIDDIFWVNSDNVSEIKEECVPTTIIVQGNYEFIENINKYLNKEFKKLFKECVIIDCYEIFDTNSMLHNILEKHDFVFNTGGLHKKEDIFPNYKEAESLASTL